MATEIEGQGCRTRLAAKQEGDGSGAWSVALERLHDGPAQSGCAILVQQLHQVRSLIARRFALSEGEIEKHFTLGNRLLQTAAGRGVKGLTQLTYL